MPMSLRWGVPTACQVGSAVVLQMKNFLKKKQLVESSHDETIKMVCK
jgi:hypothetical protein